MDETEPPMPTERVLLLRKDLNQIRALPRIPTHCTRRDNRMPWSTVSNAALKPKSAKTTPSPQR